MANFEFPEPVPEWVDMSQSEINTEIDKLFVKFGVKEIASITAESDCEDYVKDFIFAFGEKNIIKAESFPDYFIDAKGFKDFVENYFLNKN